MSGTPLCGPGWWAGPQWETMVRHAMRLDTVTADEFMAGLDLDKFREIARCSKRWTRDFCKDGKPPRWLIEKACKEARRRLDGWVNEC